jgi:TRAP-type C4-dicarboxylate transport system permease small subunit
MAWIDRLNRFLGEWFAWLYLAAVAITAYEVVMRYVFNSPTTWAFEVTVLVCAIGYLMGGGYVTQQKAHIAISVLRDIAPARVAWWLDLFAYVVGIVAMVGFAWAAWRPALRALNVGERTGSGMNSLSPTVIKTLLVVAAVLVLLQLVAHLMRHLRSRPA